MYGEALMKLRKRSGLTQQEVSRLSGVSVPTISRLENGAPAAPKLAALLDVYGATFADLHEASLSDDEDAVPGGESHAPNLAVPANAE
jgi:transcriptional regulator with XRE-family HTH domain